MTEEQRKINDNPLWWEHEKKRQQSIERWSKSPPTPEEMMEQAERLKRSLASINQRSRPS